MQPANAPYNMGVVSLTGERKAEMILQEEFSEGNGDISPNGRWIAYESNESGRNEVYVRPFPEVNTARWQISTDGGTRPLWARNGRELFYYALPGVVMAVPVVDGVSFAAGAPKVVFKGTYLAPFAGRMYDVSPDGRRFLMIKNAQGGEEPPPQLVRVAKLVRGAETAGPRQLAFGSFEPFGSFGFSFSARREHHIENCRQRGKLTDPKQEVPLQQVEFQRRHCEQQL